MSNDPSVPDPYGAAAAGAALLDKREPGWYCRVRPDTLDINSLKNCVLGQVFGHYSTGRHLLGLSLDPSVHGFDTPGDDEDMLELEDAWREEVKARWETCHD